MIAIRTERKFELNGVEFFLALKLRAYWLTVCSQILINDKMLSFFISQH